MNLTFTFIQTDRELLLGFVRIVYFFSFSKPLSSISLI